jgi:hypothetical protein
MQRSAAVSFFGICGNSIRDFLAMDWEFLGRLEAAADLCGAITAAIDPLAADGWEIEAEPRFRNSSFSRLGSRKSAIDKSVPRASAGILRRCSDR